MKKLAVTIAALGLALGAFGQGAVVINNGSSAGGPCLTTAGNYYGGAFGLEVWELNSATVPTGINGVANTAAYSSLSSLGFTKVGTFTGKDNTASAGIINLGELQIPSVSPAGGNATFALAMWTGSGTSFMGAQNAGVLAFVNPTANYTASPAPLSPTLTGWSTDLVMTQVVAIPEPTSFALAGLGAAAMLIFRRRK